jgi:hypothetical protein
VKDVDDLVRVVEYCDGEVEPVVPEKTSGKDEP